jgi:hypothetical protein
MRRLPPTAAAAFAAFGLAATPARGEVTLGPFVAPLGAGRVSIVWESPDPSGEPVTLRATGRAERRVASEATGRGVHRAEINGLEPGVEFTYRVGDRDGRFVSPPDASQDVRFVVFGDSRDGDDVHRQLVEQIVRRRPDFALNTGDVVPWGGAMGAWRNFFSIARPLLSLAPFTGVRGNHDTGGAVFEQLFPMRSATPGAGRTYGSVDLGPVHFVLIDSESSVDRGSPQYAFVARDLAANEARPVFVLTHRPLFSSGYHGGDRGMQQALAPLFQRYGVDVVLQGHDHDYERSAPINGVTYVVTGGAGAPLRGVRPSEWTRVAESVHHFVTVDASTTRVHVRATRLDGSTLDDFELDPRANNGRFGAERPLPTAGGGGCAMLFTSGPPRRADRADLGTALPVAGALVVRRARRKRPRLPR